MWVIKSDGAGQIQGHRKVKGSMHPNMLQSGANDFMKIGPVVLKI